MIEKIKRSGCRMRLASLMLVFLVSRATVYGRLNVNVALNRPAFMSSMHNEPDFGGDYLPSKAVDGNKDPVAVKVDNSCINTCYESNPWWAVDLGAALAVVGVLFTNRGDEHYHEIDNFIVGLTDVSPAVTAPTVWNYTVCAQYPGVINQSVTVYLPCTSCVPARRYLIVQLERTNWLLNFCEIEVYIRQFDWKESRGKRMINKVASTFQVDRRVSCLANCTMSPVCDSYNYRAADKTCQFNTHDTPLIANSTDIVDDGAWGWWSTPFTQLL